MAALLHEAGVWSVPAQAALNELPCRPARHGRRGRWHAGALRGRQSVLAAEEGANPPGVRFCCGVERLGRGMDRERC
jgi:hypothetical protein